MLGHLPGLPPRGSLTQSCAVQSSGVPRGPRGGFGDQGNGMASLPWASRFCDKAGKLGLWGKRRGVLAHGREVGRGCSLDLPEEGGQEAEQGSVGLAGTPCPALQREQLWVARRLAADRRAAGAAQGPFQQCSGDV